MIFRWLLKKERRWFGLVRRCLQRRISMASVFDKVMNLLGVRDEDEDYNEEIEEQEEQEEEFLMPRPITKRTERERNAATRKNNLVSLSGGQKPAAKMVILEPAKFEEVRAFVDHLKNKRSVIIRLDKLDRD